MEQTLSVQEDDPKRDHFYSPETMIVAISLVLSCLGVIYCAIPVTFVWYGISSFVDYLTNEPEIARFYLMLVAAFWVITASIIAYRLSKRAIPFDLVALPKPPSLFTRCSICFCYFNCVALILPTLPTIPFFGVSIAGEAFSEGREVVSREFGPGLSRGPGYIVMGIASVVLSIVLVVVLFRSLSTLLPRAILSNSGGPTWDDSYADRLKLMYASSTTRDRLYLRFLCALDGRVKGLSNSDIETMLARMESR